jgi:hypothetical protein
MAIATDVRTYTIGELLGDLSAPRAQGMDLRIPDYQRSYQWAPELALQLFDDLDLAVGPAGRASARSWSDVQSEREASSDQRPPYMIGSLILHTTHRPSLPPEGSGPSPALPVHDVVDGQQRLLTLLMLRGELLDPSRPDPLSAHPEDPDHHSPARRVRDAFRVHLRPLEQTERRACWQVISQRARMVVISTDDLDEAFSIFDSQNTRGRGLAPHDLLKAHHLREMRHVSEAQRIAAIEKWERTDQEDLRHLFARYLYRIARWSQGLDARSFTARDINLFKGIPASGRRTPAQRYHAAAQALIPAIQQWDLQTVGDDTEEHRRRMNHARFRLDAPVVAGGPFFEMVDFFLEELRRLRHDDRVVPVASRPGESPEKPSAGEPSATGSGAVEWESIFGTRPAPGEELTMRPSRSTMFYVSELYLAAMLYAVNCFGEEAVIHGAPLIRRWAFAPRTVKHAVQEVSIDLHSTQQQALFPAMHRYRDLGALLRHPVPLPRPGDVSPRGKDAGTRILLEAGLDPRSVYPVEEETS